MTLFNDVFNMGRSRLSGFKSEMRFIALCLGVTLCAPLANALLSIMLVDEVILGKDMEWLTYLPVCSIAIFIVFGSVLIMQKKYQFHLTAKASLNHAKGFIQHGLRLPLLFYSKRHKSEMIIDTARVELMISLLIQNLSGMLVNGVLLLVCMGIMFYLDRVLFVGTGLIYVVLIWVIKLITGGSAKHERRQVQAYNEVYMHSMAVIRNMETIHAASLQELVLEKWRQLFIRKLTIQETLGAFHSLLKSSSQLAGAVSAILILGVGAFRVSRGDLSVGNVIAFYSVYMYFIGVVLSFNQMIKEWQMAMAANQRVVDIESQVEDDRFINQDDKGIHFENDAVAIECREVCFQYPDRKRELIDHISLYIKKGEHVAFVGSTGSGKSTLAKLIAGLYPATSGRITLFSKTVDELAAGDLGRLCACVSQEITLFSGTILDNLTLWSDTVPLTRVWEAIHAACLDEVIESRGLYAMVEENGWNFSGGERQRLEIARALIQGTPILVLDEATSALDAALEEMVIGNLRKLNKTILHVAHRLSAIRYSDQIVVMEQGRVVEQGTHDNLIARRNIYYELVNKQLRQPSW